MSRTTFALAVAIALLVSFPLASYAKGSHSVKGYSKKNGTHVAPHRATDPDKSKANNYTSKGDANPYTGKEGSKDPNKR